MVTKQKIFFQLRYFINLISILLQILGLYFTYKWTKTFFSTSEETKEKLMGDFFYKNFSNNVLIFASFFITFQITKLLINITNWEISTNKQEREIYKVNNVII